MHRGGNHHRQADFNQFPARDLCDGRLGIVQCEILAREAHALIQRLDGFDGQARAEVGCVI